MASNGQAFRRALVTGGAGFIGSHLTGLLIKKGLEVTVLDNFSVGRRENVPAAARLIEGDILDEALVRQCSEGCHVVFHLAARVAIRSSFEFAREDALVNVAGTASVLRGATLARTVRKVITTSSMAVYADSVERRLVDENHLAMPASPYGVSKLAAERLTHLMCEQAGIQSVVLRLFNTYGPGQQWSPYVGVVTIFINQLLRGQSPVIFGDGEQCRDFVHVSDVARSFVRAMGADVTGRTFNIGSGVPRTVNAVFDIIRTRLNSAIRAQRAPAARGELLYSVADIGQARRVLGYEPRQDFHSSLNEAIDAIQSQKAPITDTPLVDYKL
jgi:UDP-glucose 4-epimerase